MGEIMIPKGFIEKMKNDFLGKPGEIRIVSFKGLPEEEKNDILGSLGDTNSWFDFLGLLEFVIPFYGLGNGHEKTTYYEENDKLMVGKEIVYYSTKRKLIFHTKTKDGTTIEFGDFYGELAPKKENNLSIPETKALFEGFNFTETKDGNLLFSLSYKEGIRTQFKNISHYYNFV